MNLRKIGLTFLLLITLVVKCGNKVTPVPPTHQDTPPLREQLMQELSRLRSSVKWQGIPGTSIEVLTPDDNSDLGDTMYRGGLALWLSNRYFQQNQMSSSPFLDILDFLRLSIQPDGRPLRSPLWQGIDSFSKDQLLGVILISQATGYKKALYEIWNYYKLTGKLCPDATDNKCDLTPAVEVLWKDAMGMDVNPLLRETGDLQILLQAKTVPDGYQMTLIMIEALLKIHQNQFNTRIMEAVRIVYERQPKNLLNRLTYLYSINAGIEDYKILGEDLLICMRSQSGGGSHWLFEQSDDNWCRVNGAYGHELIALSYYLLQFI